jgi:elongation factor Ts
MTFSCVTKNMITQEDTVAVNAQDVKSLREKTGAGIMDCKKALIESNGDFDKAVKFLKEKGLAEAKKRSGREAREGSIAVSYAAERNSVVMAEINCETDFVARTDNFKDFVQNTVDEVLKHEVENVDNLPSAISERVKEAAATFGENILLRRIARFDVSERGKSVLYSYIHLNGKVGVIVEYTMADGGSIGNEDVQELMKNVSLQIASMDPVSLTQNDFPEELIEEQKGIFMQQARESGKPEKILEKIVMGRMKKYFAESCLLEQKYVKDSNLTVGEYMKVVSDRIGAPVTVKRFARFKLGEE